MVYPTSADAEGPCEGGDGDEYSATDTGAANWFHIGDCGSEKSYAVDPDRTYRIVAYADDCSLDQAAFAIEERDGDGWRVAREVGPTDVSTSTSDSVDDRLFGDAGDIGIRLRTGPTHELLYSPEGSQIRLRSLGDLCNPGAYVTMYEYPLLARSTATSVGPEAYTTGNVPGVTLHRNQDLPPDYDRYADVPGNEYRFEYEGAGSQSVVLHKRDETENPENRPCVLYWFELSSQFLTARTDSPPRASRSGRTATGRTS